MAHTSPATYLVWSTMSVLLGAFLVYHLWSFDRFKCLKWNNGPYSGAFKRVMTYTYLLNLPCIMAYSIGFAIIKYTEGFVAVPSTGLVVPKPFTEWRESSHNAIFPLTLLFAMSNAFELVTHLEELCFWHFLVNASSEDWFRSKYFKIWVGGSVVALIYMPLAVILTRHELLRCEAVAFFAGSLGSFILTVAFLPVLFKFPSFLANLKREGVETATVIRLTKFHELNTIRICFRFLFNCPVLILGIDGVRPHVHSINENMLWTDLLAIVAAIGCVVSSAITLVIFFPRDIGSEIANREIVKERKRQASSDWRSSRTDQSVMSETRPHRYSLTSSLPPHDGSPFNDRYAARPSPITPLQEDKAWVAQDEIAVEPMHKIAPIRPNRKRGDDVELGGIGPLSSGNPALHNRTSGIVINRAVFTYTSPIDLAYAGNTTSDTRFTFARR
ncbi:hypothetical protein D9758_006667 [Tetrapyrgos nigripes]|uniref:Uncharacterized protein n=1 Tax=Tetrapyrgos nigripes TaxID=182062 RepID=A0A8H5LQM6_9AGAR|nr:hypothetical protein D9758_006667 [Tetrapyrgos nigripes]